MLANFLAKIFGTKNDRLIKKYFTVVEKINALEGELSAFSDDRLKEQTAIFKSRLTQGETLDQILPEAFATVREVSKRVLGLRHYDVQLVGGIVLHEGSIAEMKTGEGKTLVATLPLYLNALAGPVHLVTVNDYLAKRDCDWKAPIYNFLGLSCKALQHDQSDEERRDCYKADIVYGTNSEFGFDYLRDNMKFSLNDFVQSKLAYAIVDEVDSILIDEARTPLIISGPSEKDSKIYKIADEAVRQLSKENDDFEVDEKAHSVVMTESGIDKVEAFLSIKNIYSPENVLILHTLNQALKARFLFKKDVDYLVSSNKQILIVDEFTGRALPGRRFSDGLHQAIEAKEGVKIERESQTLAMITLQNYFRMYKKLAGMTGTAVTDAVEFHKIYKLNVVVIPTHQPVIRADEEDGIYLTQKSKYKFVVDDIAAAHTKGQPVLVGTASIEASEHLSGLLKRVGIPHNVLNAKQHQREAEIVKEAGEVKKVTISTSMAGRGTDIKLGQGVKELGGLRVIGTERYENRRIDDQLRGRSGRQGDPGSSKFYVSLEDDLMRIFGGDKVKDMMIRYAGMQEDEVIESSLASSMIKDNQHKQELKHFDTRKHNLEYDDVMNQQRNIVYSYRKDVMTGGFFTKKAIEDIIRDTVEEIFRLHKNKKRGMFSSSTTQEDLDQALMLISEMAGVNKEELEPTSENNVSYNQESFIIDTLVSKYNATRDSFSQEVIYKTEKWLILSILDYAWKNHLQNLDHLKEGIGLRGYGQKQPLYEYKKESFEMFSDMIKNVKLDIFSRIFRIAPEKKDLETIQEIIEKIDNNIAEMEPNNTSTPAPSVTKSQKKPMRKK